MRPRPRRGASGSRFPKARAGGRSVAAALLAAVLLVAACRDDGGDSASRGLASTGAATAGTEAPRERPEAAGGAAGPGAETYRLRLVNPGRRFVVVYADGGADRVVLDTVPGGDSVRVNLRIRTDRVRLEAEADGTVLGAGEVRLFPDSIVRWVASGSGPEDRRPPRR